jgi:hypothetical protein
MSQSSEIQPPPFLARLSTLSFVFLCAVAAIFGAILVFLLAAFVSAIVIATTGISDDSYKGPVILLSLAGGLILPPFWLILRRRRDRHQLSSSSQPRTAGRAVPPCERTESPAIEPHGGLPPGRCRRNPRRQFGPKNRFSPRAIRAPSRLTPELINPRRRWIGQNMGLHGQSKNYLFV